MLRTVVSPILIFFFILSAECFSEKQSTSWFFVMIPIKWPGTILAISGALASKDALGHEVHWFMLDLVNCSRNSRTKYFQTSVLPSSHMTPSRFYLCPQRPPRSYNVFHWIKKLFFLDIHGAFLKGGLGENDQCNDPTKLLIVFNVFIPLLDISSTCILQPSQNRYKYPIPHNMNDC